MRFGIMGDVLDLHFGSAPASTVHLGRNLAPVLRVNIHVYNVANPNPASASAHGPPGGTAEAVELV